MISRSLCSLGIVTSTILSFSIPAMAQSADEVRFAKSILRGAQTLTLQKNREYCGYIGVNQSGNLVATPPKRGRKNTCRADEPPEDWPEILASYHSHGGFTYNADSEVPSTSDIAADHDEETNGYLVTPGGRMWFIDGAKKTARQICGIACLQQDPDFEAEVYGKVKKSYTFKELDARENE